MQTLDRKILNVTLFSFLTLVIMNSIKFLPIIESIGSIGKLVLCSLFILWSVLFIGKSNIKVKVANKFAHLSIAIIILSFAAISISSDGNTSNLAVNLAFPIYIIFYYYVIRTFLGINISDGYTNPKNSTKIDFLRIFRFTLFFNLILWYAVAILMGAPLQEGYEYGGFFQDEIHFGLYAVTGLFVTLYLRYNNFWADKSMFNVIQIGIYLVICCITSRNALAIVLAALVYFFIVSKVKNKFYAFLLLIFALLVVNLDLIALDLSFDNINYVSSGRFLLWTMAFLSIMETGFFMGKGLFNLNDIVLEENRFTGFYYLDSLDTLSFHSSYIELLAGGGIIVLILFFVIIIRTWSKLGKLEKSMAFGILIGAVSESYLVQPFMLISSLFYFILLFNSSKIEIRLDRRNFTSSKDVLKKRAAQ